jgi:hypothetical protein
MWGTEGTTSIETEEKAGVLCLWCKTLCCCSVLSGKGKYKMWPHRKAGLEMAILVSRFYPKSNRKTTEVLKLGKS